MNTIKDLLKQGLVMDLPFTTTDKAVNRKIAYYGPCWYSMDADKIYRAGKQATFSRIRIHKAFI